MQRVAEQAGCNALKVHVDVGLERRRGDRREIRAGARLVHDASPGIDLDELAPLLAVQDVLVLLLEPLLADLLAGLVVRGVLEPGELRLADLADVSDEGRHDFAVGIEPARGTLDDQPGELCPMLLEHAHHVERRIGNDDGRPSR